MLKVFNMSATVARQEGRLQLEKSNMHLASNMAKMANRGCFQAEIEQTQYVIKTFRAEFWKEKMWRVEIPGH